MTWDKGFNFRQTAGYVTDGADETYVLVEAYPTTRNGVTFGYTSTPTIQTRDRSAVVDRRLAGLHYDDVSGATFKVDLPAAGAYTVRLALGDQANPQTVEATVKDGGTTLITIAPTAVAAGSAADAAGVVYTDAAWPGSNTAVTVTMVGTQLSVVLPAVAGRVIAHLFISQVVPPATKLVCIRQPSGAASGVPLDYPPLYAAVNNDGTLDQTYTGNVTLTGTGLSGTLTVACAYGAAYFTNVIITGTSPVVIHAASGSLTPVDATAVTPVTPQYDAFALALPTANQIELPRVMAPNPYPATISSSVTVGASGRTYTTIQAALTALVAADTALHREIIVDNSTSYGDLLYPTRAAGMGKIIIRSVTLPPDNTRIVKGTAIQLAMPKILSTNTAGAVQCQPGAHDIYLVGIWIQMAQPANDGIEYFVGFGPGAQQQFPVGSGTVTASNGLATFSTSQAGVTGWGPGATLIVGGLNYRIIYTFSNTTALLDANPSPTFGASAFSYQMDSSLATMPYNMGIDRCAILASDTTRFRRGIALNCGAFSGKDSIIDDVHDFYNDIITAGTGTVTIVADTATFSVSQAATLVNDTKQIKIGASYYTVTAFDGTTHCTLAGAGSIGASAFTIYPFHANVAGGSYISGVSHSGNGNGDTNAIGGWGGTGPFTFTNCGLTSAGDVFIFGGADPNNRDVIPSDITLTRCTVLKPAAWKGLYPAKNNFELKNTRRVLLEGCEFNGAWKDGQVGDCFVLGSVNQSQTAPWGCVSHVTIRSGVVRNVQTIGTILTTNTANAVPLHSLSFHDMVVVNIDGLEAAFDGNDVHFGFLLVGTLSQVLVDVVIRHNTLLAKAGRRTKALAIGTGDSTVGQIVPMTRSQYGDNIATCESYGIIGNSLIGKPATGAFFLEDASGGNTLIAPNTDPTYTTYAYNGGSVSGTTWPTGALFPATIALVGFADPTIISTWDTATLASLLAALTLLPTSASYHTATDGRDRGADIAAIISAMLGATTTPTTPATSRSRAARLDEAGFGVFTNANRWR